MNAFNIKNKKYIFYYMIDIFSLNCIYMYGLLEEK